MNPGMNGVESQHDPVSGPAPVGIINSVATATALLEGYYNPAAAIDRGREMVSNQDHPSLVRGQPGPALDRCAHWPSSSRLFCTQASRRRWAWVGIEPGSKNKFVVAIRMPPSCPFNSAFTTMSPPSACQCSDSTAFRLKVNNPSELGIGGQSFAMAGGRKRHPRVGHRLRYVTSRTFPSRLSGKPAMEARSARPLLEGASAP